MRVTRQMEAMQITKDSLTKAKSAILEAIRNEQNTQLIASMEFICGKIETLQSRIKP